MNLLLLTNIHSSHTNPRMPLYCENADDVLENICVYGKRFDRVLIINDLHCFDKDPNEFKYIPKHGCDSDEIEISKIFLGRIRNNVSCLTKRTFDACRNNNIQILLDREKPKICVGGFVACMDVQATAFGLIDSGHEVLFNPMFLGCVTKHTLENTIRLFDFMNIKRWTL